MGKSLKGKELGSGLSQRKDGRYQAKYYIPGSPKPKYLYDRNLAKLKKKRDLEKAKYILGYNDKAKKYKVSEWFDVWMKLYKIGRIKANTVRGYVDGFERGADFIGSVRLDCLTPSHIYNMVEGMQSDGYAESSVVHTLSIVKQLLQSAVDNQMIPMNPCKGIAIEKSEKVTVDPILEDESKILQPEEIKTFLDAEKNTRYYELFYIILNTGMRIGEITALCWSDIDFEKGTLAVNRQVQWQSGSKEHGNGYWYFSEPKYNSFRTISLDNALIDLLKREKQRQDRAAEYYADKYGLEYAQVYAIIKTESGFKPNALSGVGARGLMQITEETFEWIKTKIAPSEPVTFDDLYDPEVNIRFGTYYLYYCMDRYAGDFATASAAYHSGQGLVDQLLEDTRYSADGVTLHTFPYEQMNLYVHKVQRNYAKYQELYP